MLDELMILLRDLPECYDDFIVGMRLELEEEPDYVLPLYEYVHENPACSPSDVIGRLWDLEGNDRTPLSVIADDELTIAV